MTETTPHGPDSSLARRTFRRLTGDAFVYGFGRIASQLVGLFFFPIYTRLFTETEYGVLSTVNVVFFLLTELVPLGLAQAAGRLLIDRELTDGARRRMAGTGLIATAVLAAIVTPPLLFGARPIAEWLLTDDQWTDVFRLAVLAIPFNALRFYSLSVLRARFRKWAFAIVSTGSVLLLAATNILTVVILGMGVIGNYIGGLVSLGTFGIVAVVLIAREVTWTVDRRVLRKLLAYGIPLVPISIAFWVMGWVDRAFLVQMKGLAATGLYEAASKVALFMAFVVFMMERAFAPLSYEIAHEPDARRTYARILTAYAVLAGGLTTGLSLLAPEILGLLAGEPFRAGVGAAPWLVAAAALAGLSTILGTGVHIVKRPIHVTWITLLCAAINVAGNLLLIPAYGIVGAAASTLIAYAAMALLFAVVATRLFPVPYEWSRLALVAAAAATAILVGAGQTLLIRTALLVAFPVALFLLRVLRARDVRTLAETFFSRRS